MEASANSSHSADVPRDSEGRRGGSLRLAVLDRAALKDILQKAMEDMRVITAHEYLVRISTGPRSGRER